MTAAGGGVEEHNALAASGTTEQPPREWRGRGRQLAERYVLVLVLALLCLLLSLRFPDTFARLDTVTTLTTTQAVLGILAVSCIFVLIVGEFDLSLGFLVGFSAMLMARLDGTWGWAAAPAAVATIAAAATVGLINGLLVARYRINSFVATLGTGVVLSGIVLWISNSQIVAEGISTAFLDAGRLLFFDRLSIAALCLLTVALIAWFVLEMLPSGRYLRVIGTSIRSALLIGLPVERLKILAFVVAATFAGFAGILNLAQLGSATPSSGPDLLLPAYAIAFLSATAIRPGRFNVWGGVVALFVLAVVITGIQLWGGPSWVEPIFNGAALIIAVALSNRMARGRAALEA